MRYGGAPMLPPGTVTRAISLTAARSFGTKFKTSPDAVTSTDLSSSGISAALPRRSSTRLPSCSFASRENPPKVRRRLPIPAHTGRESRRLAYVWDYSGKIELIRCSWDAAVELNPEAAKLDEGVRFPLCRPEALTDLFAGAGLCGAEVTAIDITTSFAGFEDYWRPFVGGQGPAPAYAMALDDTARARLAERIRERLPIQADGSISLTARVWQSAQQSRANNAQRLTYDPNSFAPGYDIMDRD